MWMKCARRISVLPRVSVREWLITVEVACASNPVPLLDSAKTRLCVPRHWLIKPIMWQATSSNDDDFPALCPFDSILDHLLTPPSLVLHLGIKMMCNPTRGVGESRVNAGLRQGYCTGLADSCDNYHVVYYNLMLNLRFHPVCCLTKHFKGIFYYQLGCMSRSHTWNEPSGGGKKKNLQMILHIKTREDSVGLNFSKRGPELSILPCKQLYHIVFERQLDRQSLELSYMLILIFRIWYY